MDTIKIEYVKKNLTALKPTPICFLQLPSCLEPSDFLTDAITENIHATGNKAMIIKINKISYEDFGNIPENLLIKKYTLNSSNITNVPINDGIRTFLLAEEHIAFQETQNNFNIYLIISVIKNQIARTGLGSSFNRTTILCSFQSLIHISFYNLT